MYVMDTDIVDMYLRDSVLRFYQEGTENITNDLRLPFVQRNLLCPNNVL